MDVERVALVCFNQTPPERQWLELEAGCRNVLQLGIIATVNLGLGVLELIFRPDWEVSQRRVEVKSESPRDHTA